MNVGIIGHIDICDLNKLALKLAEEEIGLIMVSPKKYGNKYDMPIGIGSIDVDAQLLRTEMTAKNIVCIVGNPVAGIDFDLIQPIIDVVKHRKDMQSELEMIIRPIEIVKETISYKDSFIPSEKDLSQQGWKGKRKFF